MKPYQGDPFGRALSANRQTLKDQFTELVQKVYADHHKVFRCPPVIEAELQKETLSDVTH
jgi:hypothetical protein